ncbi:MAG: hypothetical protein JNM22_06890 [Saprospiraceae bacterium]|nr:hypothetical protein [Saprospiraceae bacterium]
MKNYLLHLTLAALCLIFFSTAQAQEAPKREVGLQFSGIDFNGFNTFGGFYKKQLHDNVYRRIRFVSGGLFSAFQEDNSSVGLSLAGAIGREKRKSLDRKLEFYRGPEFSLRATYQYQQLTEGSVLGLIGRVGYVLGLQHSFSDLWAIQIETIPGVSLGASFPSEGDIVGTLDASFSNAVLLGVARKF